MQAPAPTYRAFLSYSHRDKAWGDWLHAALERYRVPRELVGQASRYGALPANLRPIFRDRDDLEAGHSLHEQVERALASSDALIVMCSPDSARSAYVNEEIRRFKMLGKTTRIYPIIVRGEPGHVSEDCFPPALRQLLDDQGQPTGEKSEPIAADARAQGDGKELALLKVIAGLLGVDLDELRKREAIEARRRQQRTQLVAGFMAALALAAMFAAIYALDQRDSARTAQIAAQTSEAKARAAQQVAEQRRVEAERRYDQALDSTLNLVTIAATLRSLIEKEAFAVSQVQGKMQNDDFMGFLQGARDPNLVWLRLAKLLVEYSERLPPELERYGTRLNEAKLPLQWAQHAQVIVENIKRGSGNKPEYAAQLEAIKQRLVALNASGPPAQAATAAPPHAELANAVAPGALLNAPFRRAQQRARDCDAALTQQMPVQQQPC